MNAVEPCHGCAEVIYPCSGLANTGSALNICVNLRSSAAKRRFSVQNCDVALSSCLEQRPNPDADESCSRQVIQVFHADMLGYKTTCQHTDSGGNHKGHRGPNENGPLTNVPARGEQQCCQLRLVAQLSDKYGRKHGQQYLDIHKCPRLSAWCGNADFSGASLFCAFDAGCRVPAFSCASYSVFS